MNKVSKIIDEILLAIGTAGLLLAVILVVYLLFSAFASVLMNIFHIATFIG